MNKIKEYPRVVTSIICIIMVFFRFVNHYTFNAHGKIKVYNAYREGKLLKEGWRLADKLSGIDIVQLNYVFLLAFIIPLFVIFVDINVIKIEKTMVEKIILVASFVHIGIVLWMYIHGRDIAIALNSHDEDKGTFGLGVWITLICIVVNIIYTLKKSFNVDVVEEIKNKAPIDKIPLDKVDIDAIREKASNINIDAIKNAASNINVDALKEKTSELSKNAFAGKSVICNNCGQKNSITQKFCGGCGSPVVVPKPMVCNSCNKTYSPDTKFCPSCGSKTEEYQPLFCAECGYEIKKKSKFCPKCGAEVSDNGKE